jgi:hypothetical protein
VAVSFVAGVVAGRIFGHYNRNPQPEEDAAQREDLARWAREHSAFAKSQAD